MGKLIVVPSKSSKHHGLKRSGNRRFKRRIHIPNRDQEELGTANNTNKKPTIDSSLIVNFSSRKLTENEESVFSKGSNFCPTPLDVNWAELDRDVSEFIRRLRLKEFFHYKPSGKEPNPFKNKSNWCPPKNRDFCLEQFIHKIEEEVRNFRPKRVKDNLTVDERRTLRSLCEDNSIVIKPEDKGSSLVVQDKSNYISKACEELNNGSEYFCC